MLAGGFGTRVSHLLPGLPKPMAPVARRPFVEWVVRYFAQFGCREFHLSTGFLADIVESHFKHQPVPGVRITCHPETEPLGTAGGCLNSLPPASPQNANRLWMVVNGDSLVFADPRPLWSTLSAGSPHGPTVTAALLGLALPDAGRFGSLDIAADGVLRSFQEKRPGPGTINAGVYAFTEAALRALPTQRPLSFELDVFPPLARQGTVRVVTVEAPFLDIGTPATLTEAERFIATHQAHFP